MARYEKGRKEETHQRVVQLASERFRRDGIDGVGVAALMAEAGLTHGGFYAHFDSKESLVREAVAYAMAAEQAAGGRDGTCFDLGAYIDRYLCPGHRDRPGKGCAIAALAPDLARRPRASRQAFTKESQQTLERIAAALPETVPDQDRLPLAMTVFSQLLGSLQLARFVTDRLVSDRILENGRIAARRLAGLDREPRPHPADEAG